MTIQLSGDSGIDLNDKLKNEFSLCIAPFSLDIENRHYLDDDSLDIGSYIDTMLSSKESPKTAAPSPMSFSECMKNTDETFVVTISSKLSASYQNALIAKNEASIDKKIHVFDSKSAACGETAVVYKIQECIKNNLKFEEIVSYVENYISKMHTYFVLEDISNLIKNGRMPKIAGKAAQYLSIKPLCIGVDGEIKVDSLSRGLKKALQKLVGKVKEDAFLTDDYTERTLFISHVDNLDRALELKDMILSEVPFKSSEIVECSGLSSTYANNGGIVVVF